MSTTSRALAAGVLAGALVAAIAPGGVSAAVVYDLRSDWSDAANPNGVWTYREGTSALPFVASWESALGSFSSPQPGWALDGNSTSRIPFWFRSSASPTFAHDWLPGDVVIHTRDDANGIGTGPGAVAWTSPLAATVDVSGSVWMGRDIGRANDWSLRRNGVVLSTGSISSGDPYDRTNPFPLASGSGGTGALNDIPVSPGDVLELRIERTTQYGDFVGVNLTVTAEAQVVPSIGGWGPAVLGSLLVACGAIALRRRTVSP